MCSSACSSLEGWPLVGAFWVGFLRVFFLLDANQSGVASSSSEPEWPVATAVWGPQRHRGMPLPGARRQRGDLPAGHQGPGRKRPHFPRDHRSVGAKVHPPCPPPPRQQTTPSHSDGAAISPWQRRRRLGPALGPPRLSRRAKNSAHAVWGHPCATSQGGANLPLPPPSPSPSQRRPPHSTLQRA